MATEAQDVEIQEAFREAFEKLEKCPGLPFAAERCHDGGGRGEEMTYLEYLAKLFPNGKDALEIAIRRCPSTKEKRGRECDCNCSRCWLSEMPENDVFRKND